METTIIGIGKEGGDVVIAVSEMLNQTPLLIVSDSDDINVSIKEDSVPKIIYITTKFTDFSIDNNSYKNFRPHPIMYTEDGNEQRIGSVCVTETSIITDNHIVEWGYYDIMIKLGAYRNIRNTATTLYTVTKEQFEQVLFREHHLFNTADGTEIIVNVVRN